MKAYIIRHAEKVFGGHYNPRLRHQDEPLTPRGQEQAEKLVAYFAGKPVARIYVSEYVRTMQTAAYLARQLAIEPVIDERLNEIDNGLIEGLDDAEIEKRYPEVWRAFRERTSDFRFPGGETGEEARNRVASLLTEKRLEGGDVILICHEGGLSVFWRATSWACPSMIAGTSTSTFAGLWRLPARTLPIAGNSSGLIKSVCDQNFLLRILPRR